MGCCSGIWTALASKSLSLPLVSCNTSSQTAPVLPRFFRAGWEHTQFYVWLRGVTRTWESSTSSRTAGYCEWVAGMTLSGSSCVHMNKVQGCRWVMFPAAWVDLALCNHTEWRNHSMLCFPGSSSKPRLLFSKSRLSSISSCIVGLST